MVHPRYRFAAFCFAFATLGACAPPAPDREPPVEPAQEHRTGGVASRAVVTVGLDRALTAAALEEAAALPRLHTLLVARHGQILVERHFRGPAPDQPANVKSVSKSVLSAIVGIAIAEGHIESADQRIVPYFERHLRHGDDDRKREITVGHLLSMQSGLERTSGPLYGRWVTSPNWVSYALSRPIVADPGGARLYSTGNSHLLSALLTQATGRNTWDYAREKLAEPLGFTLPRWPTDPQGIYFGGNEMRMTPRAMVRFGELYRNGGVYEGRQVVPAEWVRESLRPRAALRRGTEEYGYGWFLSEVRGHPMFYAWGYGGQFIFVIPGLELTVVTTSNPDVAREGEHLRAVRQILREWIVPAAEAGEGGAPTA
jgi:CubicO group peptidase (beta-lactamase class C family)